MAAYAGSAVSHESMLPRLPAEVPHSLPHWFYHFFGENRETDNCFLVKLLISDSDSLLIIN